MTPVDDFENLSVSILNKQIIKTNLIFWIVFVLMFMITLVIFLFRVDITVTSSGVIRPRIEKIEVKPLVNVSIDKVFVKDGEDVIKGDTLITLNNSQLASQLNLIQSQKENICFYLADLRKLLLGNWIGLQSSLYKQEAEQFKKQVYDIQLRLSKNKKELKRNLQLFKKGFVSDKELEDIQYSVSSLSNETKMKQDLFHSKWESEMLKFSMDSLQYVNKIHELSTQLKYYTITAPYDGTIEQMRGIVPGIMVTTGQVLLVVSPNTKNIAEFYLEPKDIGFIKNKQNVRILLDAFNYAEWGYLKGKVFNVSNDFVQIQDKLYFKVKCYLSDDHLQLKNGFRGDVKKGMSIQGRFYVTNRPLYRLLFDKVNHWLNPAIND
jgi:membrane fusion protein, peptide pheromone/bacteriocin exporter